MDGRFIVLEGIDASGSTTQARRLQDYLEREGHSVLLTSEPSTGPVGMLVRLALERRLTGPNYVPPDTEISEPAFTPLDVHTLALLFAADRVDHLTAKILPAIRRGQTVISDRYLLSSLGYQGLHMPTDWLLTINQHAITPDLTFFLDVPVEHTNLRIKNSRHSMDLYERLPEQRQVQDLYREIVAKKPPELGPVVTVDATRSISAVEKVIRNEVMALLSPSDAEDRHIPLFGDLP